MTVSGLDKIVLVKGTCGLGNRLLALLSAIVYARLAERGVAVDWRDGYYADLGTNAFPFLFRSAFAKPLDRNLLAASVAPWMWANRLHLSTREMRQWLGLQELPGCAFAGRLFSFDPRDIHYPEDVIVVWSLIPFIGELRQHFRGRWGEWSAFDEDAILSRVLHEDLEVHPDIAARIDDISRSWPGRPRIGVHVRSTDRTTNMRRLRRRLDGLVAADPDASIFLATDSVGVEAEFRQRYPHVLTIPKWFPKKGPIHTLDSACPDRLAMARDSLVEMRLLVDCDRLVINSNSSFSRVVKLWWRGDPRHLIDIGSWAWLPAAMRDRAWRMREAAAWNARLWWYRMRIDKRRPT